MTTDQWKDRFGALWYPHVVIQRHFVVQNTTWTLTLKGITDTKKAALDQTR